LAAVVYLNATGNPPAPAVGSSSRPSLGEPSAALVVREYGDYQCPSCGAFARNVEPQLRQAYIDTGRIRFEFYDFAWIGPESRDAANAARCAGAQDSFWPYHDLLYQNQAGENAGAFTRDRLKAFGRTVGLDAAQFDRCVDEETFASAVNADLDDARRQGFSGTPTFLIGGQRIVGAQPFEVFEAAIDAALAGG
jgi:protein-disulfide isomerase